MSEPEEPALRRGVTLPEVPVSWVIFGGMIGAVFLLKTHEISQDTFLVIFGSLFGVHTLKSASAQQKTAEIAAAGTGAATVAALKADEAAAAVKESKS